MANSTIRVMDMKVEKVSVLQRTTYSTKTDRTLNGSGIVTAVIDEEYDLQDPVHRKELLGAIASAILDAAHYDAGLLDVLVREAKEVVEEVRDELPFR